MRRPQFTLRALFVAMLAAACFFGGIRFERERYAREMDELRQLIIETVVAGDEILPDDWRPDEQDSQD
jgi:hypothetical protein